MKIAKVVLGFVPSVAFSTLIGPLGVGGAALAGLVAAVVILAVTARGGVQTLLVVQAVILAAMAAIGFLGDGPVRATLAEFGAAILTLLLGVYIVATAPRRPFTAQYARSTVPQQMWHDKRFLAVNRRISTAWGLAVLLAGVCAAAGAAIARSGDPLLLRVVITWVIPVLGFWQASRYTTRTTAAARQRLAQLHAAEGVTPA